MFPEQERAYTIFNLRDIFCGNAEIFKRVLNQIEQLIQNTIPTLIIVAGPPSTGKTQLTNQLTRKYEVPLTPVQAEQLKPYVLTFPFYTQHYNPEKLDVLNGEIVHLVESSTAIINPSHIILHISGDLNIYSPQAIQALKDVIKLTDEIVQGQPHPISLLVEFTIYDTNKLPFFVANPRQKEKLDKLLKELFTDNRDIRLFTLPINKEALAKGFYKLITNPFATFNLYSDEGESELQRYFGKHADAIQQALIQMNTQIKRGGLAQETAVKQILDALNQIEREALAQLPDNTK